MAIVLDGITRDGVGAAALNTANTWARGQTIAPAVDETALTLNLPLASVANKFVAFQRDSVEVGSIVYDSANDQLEFQNIVLTAGSGANILLEDDRELRFGTSSPMVAAYDSADTRLELRGNSVVRLQTSAGTERATFAADGSLNLNPTGTPGLQIGGTTLFESDRDLAVDLLPNADGTLTSGSAARRWLSVNSAAFNVYAAGGDAQPSVAVTSNSVLLGPGGATAADAGITRGAANRVDTLAGDSFNVAADLLVGGTVVFEQDRNLAVTLLPNASGTLDLGSTSREFEDLYLGGVLYVDGTPVIEGGSTQTIYVRSAGSDSNDGRTSGTAVLTLSKAINLIQRLPIHNYNTTTVTIDLESGASFASGLQIVVPWVTKLTIQKSGAANAIITAPASASYGLYILQSRVTLSGITLQPVDTLNRHAIGINAEMSEVELAGGTIITGASTFEFAGYYNSHLYLRSDATLTAHATSVTGGIVVHSHSHASTSGTVSGYSRGMYVDRGASGTVHGTAIIDSCTYGVYVEDHSEAKCIGGSSITNCGTAAYVTLMGYFNFEALPTTTGTTKLYDSSGGFITTSTGNNILAFRSADDISFFNGNNATNGDIEFPEVTSANVQFRFFRGTTTTGAASVALYAADGSATQNIILDTKDRSLTLGFSKLYNNGGDSVLRLATGDDLDIENGTLKMAGTTLFEADRDLAVHLTPNADGTLTSGTTARRWASAESVRFNVRAAASDTNPTAQLLTTGVKFGITSADALSVSLYAGATNRLDLATGDSFNLVSGNLQFGAVTAIDSSRNATLGTVTGTSYNGLTVTTTTGTFTLTNAKTLTVSDSTTLAANSITFAGTEVLTLTAAKSVTFADAFATAGAFALTLTTTAGTNVTLPTTGTLATLAGVEALTNKTLNGMTVTASTGAFTLTNAKTLSVTNTLTLSGTDGTVMTFPGATDTVMGLGAAQTVTAAKTFNAATLKQAGAGAGVATFAYANTVTNSTLTLPTSASDTIAVLGLAQTYTAGPSFTTASISITDVDIALGTTTGTKIGTATTQKLGFYNATPIVQGTSIADPSGGATIDAEARTAVAALISRLEALGLIATV